MEETSYPMQDYVSQLVGLIRSGCPDGELLEAIKGYHDNDIAGAFEQLTPEERKHLYALLGPEKVSDVFTFIENVDRYLKELDISHAARIVENMDSDDAVDVLEEMDDDTRQQLVDRMRQEASRDIQLIQSYDDDEVGSKMTTNFILIEKNMTVKQATRSLIAQANKHDNISTIYVCDEESRFYGALDLKELIIAREYSDLDQLVSTSYPYVTDHEKISDCIEQIKDYAEDSIPVLDSDHRILGILTAQDIVEVVDDEMGDDYAKLAGLTAEEDLHESTWVSMKKRMPWLIVLLFLGMGVSTVVGMFEPVVAQLAVIVCFQSLILDMAGNVGTQSLAVTIRVLMDENLQAKQKAMLVLKEIRVGFCNGLVLGSLTFLAIGAYIYFLKHSTLLYAFSVAGCVGIALLVAMTISSLIGTVVPLFFHKIKIDPAVASGPLITTVNDLVAVVTYYGMAWLLLIQVLHLA